MPTTNITFAKLAATPTPTSWSLAYNAGNLFAAFSLSQKDDAAEPLSTQGKKITSILQSEFFTLEEKTLSTIQHAIEKSFEEVPETTMLSGCIAFLKDSIIYLYAFGAGQALLTRNGTTAPLMKESTDPRTIVPVSGYLQSGDIVLLATESFIKAVPQSLLSESFALQLPSDMAELVTPTLHKNDEGTAAAIILTFASSEGNIAKAPVIEPDLPEERKQPQPIEEHHIHPSLETAKKEAEEEVVTETPAVESAAEPVTPPQPLPTPVHVQPSIHDESLVEEETLADRIAEPERAEIIDTDADTRTIKQSRFALPQLSLPKKNLFFLTIAIGIATILLVTIVTTKQNQGDTKSHAAFLDLYNEASKTYAEGEGLMSLNKSLALDDFKKAKETLESAKQYVKSGTDDEKKYNELASKIDSQGVAKEETAKVSLSAASDTASPSLQKEASENAIAVTEDTSYIYTLSSKKVTQFDKGNDNEKDLVTNDSDWKNPQAISVYLSNIYILDKGNNILKFVAGSAGYGKSTYFKGTIPSLSNTISMSIDSSIYLLDSDGTIRKFSKGEAESFTLTGLPSPFSNPKKLYTSTDTENLYVLDNGNSRVVKLDKQGAYISSYAADGIKAATDMVVSEKDQKIYLLINKNVSQINL